MSPEMRIDSIDGITLTSVGGGATRGVVATGPPLASGPSSFAGPPTGAQGSFSPGGPAGLTPAGGGGSTTGSTCGGSPAGGPRPRFDEDVPLPLIKVVVLGAPGVGKTSIVKRFVNNDFSHEHRQTCQKSEFFPSLILNGSLFELKLIDLPVIPYFPANSLVEWSDFRSFGLRSAAAYLLVYDLSLPSTFNFIKTLRDQMYETRDMTNIPVIVIANKIDLVAASNYVQPTQSKQPQQTQQQQHQHHHHHHHHHQQHQHHHPSHHHQHHHHHHHHHGTGSSESGNHLSVVGYNNLASSSVISMNGALANGGTNTADAPTRDKKEISHLVRKTWRSSYIECSAKYNWNVVAIFKELAITLNMIANGQSIGGKSSSRKRRCLMF